MGKTLNTMLAGITALGIAGCIKEPSVWDSLENAYYKAVAAYADRNNDGVVTKEEISRLLGDIAKANNVLYIKDSRYVFEFRDVDGNFITLKKRTEMFNNYRPSKQDK